ncbi:zinc-binding dehydrogenase [Demequina sp. B12]|uniref:zinc-dependent alcohol dehydrogenase n=1 Tax=Demequina sp. B12 TaxID=2992757 RepID=UPI00237B396E|nr:zinc-binding dehydrogenase [Demequina sp. B12]MDE0572342.1 zinc-binding dehydrogenase [Demequina sp. B12]
MTDTTWAYRLTAPFQFERVEVPVPSTAGPGELLVELTAGAVCGSDLPFARGALVPAGGAGQPGRPMHEVVGIVRASEHSDFAPGDEVVGWASNWDALRGFFVTHGSQVAKVRTSTTAPLATVAQSVACLMTVFDRLGPLDGRSVGIIGVGPFGLMTSILAKHFGAGRITGVDPLDRRADAEGLPFDGLLRLNSRVWAEDITDADRPDIVIEMVGHQPSTVADGMNAVAKGGTVLAFGVPDDDWYALPMRSFFRRNGTLITGVTTHHRDTLERAQDYLIDNPWFAERIVTDVVPIENVGDAFHAACHPKPGQRKIVLSV